MDPFDNRIPSAILVHRLNTMLSTPNSFVQQELLSRVISVAASLMAVLSCIVYAVAIAITAVMTILKLPFFCLHLIFDENRFLQDVQNKVPGITEFIMSVYKTALFAFATIFSTPVGIFYPDGLLKAHVFMGLVKFDQPNLPSIQNSLRGPLNPLFPNKPFVQYGSTSDPELETLATDLFQLPPRNREAVKESDVPSIIKSFLKEHPQIRQLPPEDVLALTDKKTNAVVYSVKVKEIVAWQDSFQVYANQKIFAEEEDKKLLQAHLKHNCRDHNAKLQWAFTVTENPIFADSEGKLIARKVENVIGKILLINLLGQEASNKDASEAATIAQLKPVLHFILQKQDELGVQAAIIPCSAVIEAEISVVAKLFKEILEAETYKNIKMCCFTLKTTESFNFFKKAFGSVEEYKSKTVSLILCQDMHLVARTCALKDITGTPHHRYITSELGLNVNSLAIDNPAYSFGVTAASMTLDSSVNPIIADTTKYHWV